MARRGGRGGSANLHARRMMQSLEEDFDFRAKDNQLDEPPPVFPVEETPSKPIASLFNKIADAFGVIMDRALAAPSYLPSVDAITDSQAAAIVHSVAASEVVPHEVVQAACSPETVAALADRRSLLPATASPRIAPRLKRARQNSVSGTDTIKELAEQEAAGDAAAKRKLSIVSQDGDGDDDDDDDGASSDLDDGDHNDYGDEYGSEKDDDESGGDES